jgi:hypothetical protein
MLKSHSFDPDTVAVLQASFDELWTEFHARSPDQTRAREELAKIVMDVAKTGQRDPDRIVIEARHQLRQLFSEV